MTQRAADEVAKRREELMLKWHNERVAKLVNQFDAVLTAFNVDHELDLAEYAKLVVQDVCDQLIARIEQRGGL